jgi:hypothetical protein
MSMKIEEHRQKGNFVSALAMTKESNKDDSQSSRFEGND